MTFSTIPRLFNVIHSHLTFGTIDACGRRMDDFDVISAEENQERERDVKEYQLTQCHTNQ